MEQDNFDDECLVVNSVPSGNHHAGPPKCRIFDINSTAALGALHAGLGFSSINNFLSAINIPNMCSRTFKKHEREMGVAVETVAKETVAKESCKEAAKVERELTVRNMESLQKLLPNNLQTSFLIKKSSPIEADRSPSLPQTPAIPLNQLTSQEEHSYLNLITEDASNIVTESEHPVPEVSETSQNYEKSVESTFEDVVRLFVAYDMGWSKRGSGHQYDSLNGYSAIIGTQSGLVLDYATRNRKCRYCDVGVRQDSHDCRLNYHISAKAMESDAAVQLASNSDILMETNTQVDVFIGDNDSASISAVRKACSHTVVKHSDKNHTSRGVTNQLYNIEKKADECKEMTADAIKYLHRCFTYAVAQNAGNTEELAKAIRNIPCHAYNDHDNCGEWCGFVKDPENYSHTSVLGGFRGAKLYDELKTLFLKLADNSSKFAAGASSQANESLNGVMSRKAPKSICYSLSESADFRYACAKLVSSNTNQRNWRGILIALLVIVVVLALIVTSVVLLTPPDEGPRVRGVRFRLQDILSHEFQPLRFNGTWVSDQELLFKDQWGGISLMCASNRSVKTLMSNQTYLRLNPARFQLSPDQKYLLLAQNVQKLFRHSYLAHYIVYDIETGNEFPVRPTPDTEDHPYLLLAEWSPRGQGLVMVHNYDIYYRPSPTSHAGYRITRTAVPGVVSHGVPDWLYEEEILGTNNAIWVSSDGHMLVFASFNDSMVEELKFPWYGSLAEGRLYPDIRSLRYPKPGTRNPQVTLTVADLADPSNIRTREVKPPAALANSEFYFTAVSWISLTEICVVWLNRPQNVSLVSICKTPMWNCQETQRITADGPGWVDMGDSPLFGRDSTNYITVAPVRDGPAGYFKHAVAVNIPKGRILPLTHGKFEVTRVLAWDHSNDVIYFLGIPEGKPGEQHLYRVTSVPPRTGATLQPPLCLTCVKEEPPTVLPYLEFGAELLPTKTRQWEDDWFEDESTMTTATPKKKKNKKGNRTDSEQPCLFHNAVFSPNSAYYVLECLGPGIPTSILYKASLPQPKLLLVLQNNTLLREKVSKMAMPQIKTFPVQISGGYQAHVRLHLPPGLREDEITRYPLVVQVYGGPGSQLVTERWRIDWNTYLTGHKDIIIAQIDGRGSGGQGQQLMHKVYYKLGTVEVSDQLEVTEYLRDTLHFIDKRRVAVWGWSYGGFVAALALASPKSVFQCAIAVAPVTSWKLYDSAYTERYMGLPNVTDNYKGYEEADVSKKAQQLRDKMFFLVHGSADDNVHLQQSMALVKALAEAGTLFRQQIYPDESHGLGGVKKHLYRSMGQFLDDCFRKQVPPEFKTGLRNDEE